jgi:hypothetical protein
MDVLCDWASGMDEVRVFAWMGRQVSVRIAPNSSMADAERASTAIYAVATVTSSANGSPSTTGSSSARRNCSSSNAVRNAVSTDLHQGTGKADARAAGSDTGVAAGSYTKEN